MKKTFLNKALLFACATAILALNVGAKQLESVETPAVVQVAAEDRQTELTASESKPGLNILTGTVNVCDFEDENLHGITHDWGYSTFLVNSNQTINPWYGNELKSNSDTLCLVLGNDSAAYTEPKFNFIHLAALEKGRQYEVKMDLYARSIVNGSLDWRGQAWTTYLTGAVATTKLEEAFTTANNTNHDWYRYSNTLTATSDATLSISKQTGAAGFTMYQQLCMDNVSVIPYYKVTYYDTDGTTVLGSEQILRDESGNLLTTYTVAAPDGVTLPDGAIGWTTSVGSAPESEVSLTNSDVNLYPAFSTAPEMLDMNSIRFGENKGLRFAAVVDLKLRASDATEEYGFLATRKTLLENKGVTSDALMVQTLDSSATVGKTAEGVLFVVGRGYQKSGDTVNIDIIYDNIGGTKLGVDSIKNGKAIGITTVLTNIPSGHYKDVFVVRPYVKIAGTYYYGDVHEASYYGVANAIKSNEDEYSKLTEQQKNQIAEILSGSSAS